MSHLAMSLVAAIPLNSTKKSLLFTMAHLASDKNELIASYDELAKWSGTSRRTAIKSVSDFIRGGLIERSHLSKLNTGSNSNLYTLNISKLNELSNQACRLIALGGVQ